MASITSSVGSIFSGVGNVFSGLIESILAIFQHALNLIMGILHSAWSAVEGVINAALHVVTGLLSTVTHVFGDLIGIVTGEFDGLSGDDVMGGNVVRNGVDSVMDASTLIKEGSMDGIYYFKGVFAQPFDFVYQVGTEMIDNLSQFSSSNFPFKSLANIVPIALVGVGVILATTFAGKKSSGSASSSVKKATKSGGRRKKA